MSHSTPISTTLTLTMAMTACSLPTMVLIIVGTGILLLRPAEGEIVRMSVHRDYRRRGIATQLLAELLHLASEDGVSRIVVETNAKWMEVEISTKQPDSSPPT
jgi:ribosomal protein S18 acetylase RimI-like enzyme